MSKKSFVNSTSSIQLKYYQKLIKEYGNNHKAVSSESLEHKKCRFDQISKKFLIRMVLFQYMILDLA